MKAISIHLRANFGFFQWSKTRGDYRVSNLFLSRTEVLGILGAVIGLEGYGQQHFKEKKKASLQNPFYESLRGLHVAILPQQAPVYFEDHLIHRYMKHVNSKGSLMVKMKGLVQPHYKVILEPNTVEEKIFEKLSLYLQKGWAEFIPYLGKNQFPLELFDFQEVNLTHVEETQPMVIHSLYKQKDVTTLPKVRKFGLLKNSFHYSESLKNFSSKDYLTIVNEQTIWSSFKVGVSSPVFHTSQQENIVFL